MPKINNDTFYLNAFKKYKISPKGVNWKNKKSQEVRFEIILEFLKDKLSHKTKVIDAGCGFGDFYLFAKRKNFKFEYVGYDILQKFVDITKDRTSCNAFKKDILSDELDMADYYIASGSLNILTKFETYLFIKRCFEYSKKGFVFNFLEGDGFDKNFNTLDRDEVIEYAKELGAKVSVKDGYLSGDVSLFLVK